MNSQADSEPPRKRGEFPPGNEFTEHVVRILTLSFALGAFLFGDIGWTQDGVKGPKEDKPPLRLLLRYGYGAEVKLYPQKTPRDTLQSIIKAIIDERTEYMMAQLADPEYVDGKVAEYTRALGRDQDLQGSLAGRLGASVTVPDARLIKQGLPEGLGLVIDKVRPDSPAATAGIKEQDVLVEFKGERIENSPSAFYRFVAGLKGGVKMTALVVRNGKPEVVSVILPDLEGPNRLLAFRKVVLDTTKLWFEDAARVQELRMFARDAEWNIEGNQAVGTLREAGQPPGISAT